MGRVKDPNVNRKSSKKKHTVHWFRKGLRLSDNPALLRGIRRCETFRCIFILDPWFAGSSNVGTNKWRFLLQCLEDLDTSLRRLNSRLFVVRGQPADVLPNLFKEWNTTYFTFEEDPEPFGRVRDLNIVAMCKEMGITVAHEHSHTLYNLDKIIEANGGKPPLTYKQFQRTIEMMEAPVKPVPTITMELLTMGNTTTPIADDHDEKYGVPTLEELGFDTEGLKTPVWVGGETEALSRLERHLERKAWVASFGRPKMTPQSLLASQTGLSPYLRFGCLSTRLFYHALADLYRKIKKSEPPLSLHGQLLWREFFYCAATKNPSFDKMYGNPICVQIPWDRNEEALAKWASAHTGFPWIDAIMTQLREEGWIHHLARHAVACFLTRGDLWVSWEEGMKVFDELLLDADWSVNAGTWLWLSCSSFFQQFFHCYCPVKFGRKADANGDYIRRYLPVLKNYPTRYIHEPWTAPEAVQKSAKCIVGVDYPKPMCNHAHVSKINMERMKQVYAQLAQYRRNGQKGPGIPNELLSQMKSVPKVPRNSSVLMGPPDPPEAPRFIKKEEKHSSQNMELKTNPPEHADNQQILKQSSNRNLRQQDSMLNMQHIILNNTVQHHSQLINPIMPPMSEGLSPHAQSDGISPLVMSPVSHQQMAPTHTMQQGLYQNSLTQVPSSSGSMLLSIPYSTYSTATGVVPGNPNTAPLPILSSDMLLPVAPSHGSNEDISNISNVSQNSSIEAVNSQSGGHLDDRIGQMGSVNYNYNTALAEGFFDSNQQQT